MSNRINIGKMEPAAYKAMIALEHYLTTTGITPLHQEMIRIRASQINGCAYCINKHTRDARKAGETEQRIYALDAWRDAPFFSEEERAILSITEEVTLISDKRVSDETYEQALGLLGETYLAQVILAIITINAWNRIGISTRLIPG